MSECITNDPGRHEYADKVCQNCGNVFCFACCKNTNVHEGGKYDPDFMLCPQCGWDYYKPEEENL